MLRLARYRSPRSIGARRKCRNYSKYLQIQSTDFTHIYSVGISPISKSIRQLIVSTLDCRIYDSCGNSSDGLFHKHFGVCLPVCVRTTMFSGSLVGHGWLPRPSRTSSNMANTLQQDPKISRCAWRYCLMYSW